MSTTTTLPPTPPSEFASPVSTTKEFHSDMATAHETSAQQTVLPPQEQQHIWVITGPAGCGKTSVAESLHQTYDMPYLEGDTVSF